MKGSEKNNLTLQARKQMPNASRIAYGLVQANVQLWTRETDTLDTGPLFEQTGGLVSGGPISYVHNCASNLFIVLIINIFVFYSDNEKIVICSNVLGFVLISNLNYTNLLQMIVQYAHVYTNVTTVISEECICVGTQFSVEWSHTFTLQAHGSKFYSFCTTWYCNDIKYSSLHVYQPAALLGPLWY